MVWEWIEKKLGLVRHEQSLNGLRMDKVVRRWLREGKRTQQDELRGEILRRIGPLVKEACEHHARKCPPDGNPQDHWDSVVDEVLTRVRGQEKAPELFTRELLACMEDVLCGTENDIVAPCIASVRDALYARQFAEWLPGEHQPYFIGFLERFDSGGDFSRLAHDRHESIDVVRTKCWNAFRCFHRELESLGKKHRERRTYVGFPDRP